MLDDLDLEEIERLLEKTWKKPCIFKPQPKSAFNMFANFKGYATEHGFSTWEFHPDKNPFGNYNTSFICDENELEFL